MNTDMHLQQELMTALRDAIGADVAALGVAVEDGIAILTGTVSSMARKWAVERTVAQVGAVRAIVTKLEIVQFGAVPHRNLELARVVADTLQGTRSVPHQRITATISDGWVTLEGMVQLPEQRQDAEDALCCLAGVRGVINRITVQPEHTPELVEALIERGLWRTLGSDARLVRAEVHDTTAILRGTVGSEVDLADAEWAAWGAPGILGVENHLVVVPCPC